MISVAYWGFLFPSRSSTLQPVDFLVHGVNLIVSMSDLFISKRPYRILHFFHPLAFLTAYVAFSAIYWAAGERNEDGLPYIYVFLDWENLEFTVAFVTIGLFILLPLIHFLLWGLHCLRDFICGSGSTTRSANTDEGHVNQVFNDEMYSWIIKHNLNKIITSNGLIFLQLEKSDYYIIYIDSNENLDLYITFVSYDAHYAHLWHFMYLG